MWSKLLANNATQRDNAYKSALTKHTAQGSRRRLSRLYRANVSGTSCNRSS